MVLVVSLARLAFTLDSLPFRLLAAILSAGLGIVLIRIVTTRTRRNA
jgi:hypothetical protein